MITTAPDRSTGRVLAFATATATALTLALVGAAPASAAEANTWGTFTFAGSTRAYTGTMALAGGFPDTTFTSTSRQATTVSGASTWQAPSTPPGTVYGSSRGETYLNQRPSADNATSPAVTTYTFATPTPASGWSFVLGDIDADQATITATDATGAAVPLSGLGFQSTYNYCHRAQGPSCDSANLNDVPFWNPATGVLIGNATATDTEGASAWFSPNVPLKTLTISYQQRSGFPVYLTWFATKTFAASGTVTVNGAAYGDAPLTIRDAAGTIVATTTSGGDGSWSVPGLVSTSGYTVSVETPPGAAAAQPITFDTLDADTPGLDFAFAIPTVEATGTIVSDDGEPLANTPIEITREGDDEPTATTTTDDTGSFTADLLPGQPYVIVIDGDASNTRDFTSPTQSGAIEDPLAPPIEPTPPATAQPSPTPTATAAPVVVGAGADPGVAAPELAETGSNAAHPLGIGALLLLGGAALVVHNRRRSRRG